MPLNLNQTTAQLTVLGLDSLLQKLVYNELKEKKEFPFGSIKTAKTVMRLLYRFLWFYPEVKARTSLSLNEKIGTLMVSPRATSEKRGRKGCKR